ncbi:MAG: PAS domain-containing protein, partial [Spongiibacteraceae bacterium]|nr:PAS domain-containing protein [Spongiibacteraceae bacterium]
MQRCMDFAAIFACSPNPYLLMAADFSVVAVNQAYLNAIGRTEAEVLDRPLFTLFSPPAAGQSREQQESFAALQASLHRVRDRKAPDTLALVTFQIRGAEADGMRYWSCSHTPVLDQDGQVEFILQHVIDVTEAHGRYRRDPEQSYPTTLQVEQEILGRVRQVQEANRLLYAERLHLLRLFEEAPGFICFLRGREHSFELANRAWFDLIGERDIIGLPLRQGVPELAGQGYFELIDHVFESARPYIGSGMQMFINREGVPGLTQVYLDLVLQPIVESDGSVSGILLQGNDVTEQLHAQLELRRYRERLEELVEERTEALRASEAERRKAEQALLQSQKLESLGKLTGVVAHDFNNVLQIIGGNLQLLLRQQRDYPQLQERTRAALEGVSKGAQLASQLLAFSRRQALAPQVTAMGPLL